MIGRARFPDRHFGQRDPRVRHADNFHRPANRASDSSTILEPWRSIRTEQLVAFAFRHDAAPVGTMFGSSRPRAVDVLAFTIDDELTAIGILEDEAGHAIEEHDFINGSRGAIVHGQPLQNSASTLILARPLINVEISETCRGTPPCAVRDCTSIATFHNGVGLR
jgi:hypothetical protein